MISKRAQEFKASPTLALAAKAKELKAFIQRFSANASKSSQATSRQKQLDKLEVKDLPISTRKYPFVHFKPEREAGKERPPILGNCKVIFNEAPQQQDSFLSEDVPF